MRSIPLIKSVMTPFPYSISPGDTVSRAREMMQQHNIGHLPVKAEGKLIGVISANSLRIALQQASSEQAAEESTVEDIGVQEAYLVEMRERLDSVLLYMADAHVDAALVVKSDRLVGIFTKTDACRCFGNWLRDRFPTGGDHDAA